MSKPNTVNTKWFKQRLEDSKLSMRGLAKRIELDPSAVSLMLRGLRKMTPEEANKISGVLTVPVTEVLRQAGIAVQDDTRDLPLKAWVDARGYLQPTQGKSTRRVSAPYDVPTTGLCVQVRAPELSCDGWILFATAPDNKVEAMVDRLCVVSLEGDGSIVGVLKRGYEADRFNVIPFTGGAALENAQATSAAPVLWVRPV